jgi:hypothetical protein
MAAQLGWKFIEIAMALQYNLQKLGHGVPYNYDYPLRVNDFRLGGLEVFLIRLDQTLLDFRNQILWNVASIMVLKVSPGPGAWVKHIILKINKPTTCKFGGDGRGRSIPQQIGSASMAVHWESPKHFFPFKKVQRLGRF